LIHYRVAVHHPQPGSDAWWVWSVARADDPVGRASDYVMGQKTTRAEAWTSARVWLSRFVNEDRGTPR